MVILCRGTPISRLTDIPITDISAIKKHRYQCQYRYSCSIKLQYFHHTDGQSLVIHYFYIIATPQIMGFPCDMQAYTCIYINFLNGEDRPKFTCSSKCRLANTNFCLYRYHQNCCFDTDTDINIGASLIL